MCNSLPLKCWGYNKLAAGCNRGSDNFLQWKEGVSGAVLRVGNWRGCVPCLQVIMTLTRDDVKSLFLSRGTCLSQTQSDARNSDTRWVCCNVDCDCAPAMWTSIQKCSKHHHLFHSTFLFLFLVLTSFQSCPVLISFPSLLFSFSLRCPLFFSCCSVLCDCHIAASRHVFSRSRSDCLTACPLMSLRLVSSRGLCFVQNLQTANLLWTYCRALE